MFDAAAWRLDRERERDLWLAWHFAALSRTKKLPTLKQLLSPPQPAKVTDAELAERAAEFAALTARMGTGLDREGAK